MHMGNINVGADIVNKQMRTLIKNAGHFAPAHYQAELTQRAWRLGLVPLH